MQTSFIKIIQGHPLEFNRLLFPLRYNIVNKGLESSGLRISMEKDEKGIWKVDTSIKLPSWFDEISLDVHNAIIENENLR
ncbi:hypothetical protein [Segetibacter koreensis]|uniref:hypothetical protein n=1 Tax=Segetibacter koreensis TaxID=398037 RepID=UPI000380A993|nr:hypothetical protein [Segetibacter koreensis]